MDERSKKLENQILKILKDSGKTMGSTKITEELAMAGIESNERTVRFHLRRLDEQELTEKISRRKGRVITARGITELEGVNILGRLGFIVSKVDGLSYNMNFDTAKKEGSVVLNVSFIPIKRIDKAISEIELAFRAGLGMGRLALLRKPGEIIGKMVVPEGMVGIGTICSVTLNGLLLKEGIPVFSRFGSLLRIESGKPACFTELVDYLGTTVDPLEVFLKAGMTSVGMAARGQSGVIGASFRELPMVAGAKMEMMQKKLEELGLVGILAVGKPNQPLLNVPVNEGMIGIAVVGGLNPIAAAHEAGIRTDNSALHCLVDFNELEDYEKLSSHIPELI
ncbi:MAG TPA: NrpR regulatory domain-containing protein [bacterium]|nr:NrpR regulatory domain-containing protein [bacterium]